LRFASRMVLCAAAFSAAGCSLLAQEALDRDLGDAGAADTGTQCGDGQLSEGEGCDDGNDMAGDGCGPACTREEGWECDDDREPTQCAEICGDGSMVGDEACDDGFTDECGTCNATCTGFGAGSTCGDGVRCEQSEACDDGFEDPCGSCNAQCSGPGDPIVCGDGSICPETEVCDDENSDPDDGCGPSCDAVDVGWQCFGDPSICGPICGDGDIDAGEECDTSDLNGEDCVSLPEGGFNEGTLGCASDCTYDTSACAFNPSGTYEGTPHATFSCTYMGLPVVDFDLHTFVFEDDGTTLTVRGAPCASGQAMTGDSPVTNALREFSVSCVYSGSCTETYRLEGMFTDETSWTATFSAFYSGDCDTCDNPPNPRTWDVTATRM
jgi:cysteine-rich repeat protein